MTTSTRCWRVTENIVNWRELADFITGGAVWGDVARHLWNLALAFLLTFPIGWEREQAARTAGVRTFPLVALTSCGFVLVALSVLGRDPDAQSRVFQGMIPGIGFLGAGVIIRGAGEAKGVTTAASIWVTGAIGTAVGYGLYDIAVVLSVAAYVTLRLLAPLKRELRARGRETGPGGAEPDEDVQ